MLISILQIRKQNLNEVKQFVQQVSSDALNMGTILPTKRTFDGWSYCGKDHTKGLGW